MVSVIWVPKDVVCFFIFRVLCGRPTNLFSSTTCLTACSKKLWVQENIRSQTWKLMGMAWFLSLTSLEGMVHLYPVMLLFRSRTSPSIRLRRGWVKPGLAICYLWRTSWPRGKSFGQKTKETALRITSRILLAHTTKSSGSGKLPLITSIVTDLGSDTKPFI